MKEEKTRKMIKLHVLKKKEGEREHNLKCRKLKEQSAL